MCRRLRPGGGTGDWGWHSTSGRAGSALFSQSEPEGTSLAKLLCDDSEGRTVSCGGGGRVSDRFPCRQASSSEHSIRCE